MGTIDYVIVGLGITGQSCVEYLVPQGYSVVVIDTRAAPPQLLAMQARYPTVPVYLEEAHWPVSTLLQASTWVVSPGISIQHPVIQQAKARGAAIVGDVELFAQRNTVPVIAITGSNGKSTVTTLVGEMARCAGKRVAVLGNIGTSVLSTHMHQDKDVIVMELSSFQLETTSSLRPFIATVLNVTEDHMDRYATLEDYAVAKHRIYRQAYHRVINCDDPLSNDPSTYASGKQWKFTANIPAADEFGLRFQDNQYWLAEGERLVISERELKIMGQHNLVNALSAFTIGTAAGWEESAMCQALREFEGLPHRCQWVADKQGVQWFNDSKGTNVGACFAAVKGLGDTIPGKLVLILGGDGKGADFSTLREVITQYCRAIVVKGKDADVILNALADCVPSYRVHMMKEAVAQAAVCAQEGDAVLLSPACASLDQYQDYAHRGEIFMAAVRER